MDDGSPVRIKCGDEDESMNYDDPSYTFITENEYKAMKFENNLENLNQDICQVADELEQIKQMLF